jgi:outer membrane protein assembly factor BamD (BamD/ComL family)
MKNLIFIFLISFFCFLQINANEGFNVQRTYVKVTGFVKNKNWDEVIEYGEKILQNAPNSSFSEDVLFYLAVAYYHRNEIEKSNNYISRYLRKSANPKFYEKAFEYKFQIAKKYYLISKHHIFRIKNIKKYLYPKEKSLKIFEEIIVSLPLSELCIKSIFYKAKLLAIMKDEDLAIETLQELIRKFPKHDLAISSFLEISKIYFKKANPKHVDYDLLDLARLNVENFKKAFPKEEEIEKAQKYVNEIEEKFAEGFFEIASFFERTKKIEASKVYYKKIIETFPNTKLAKISKKRLSKLEKK